MDTYLFLLRFLSKPMKLTLASLKLDISALLGFSSRVGSVQPHHPIA